MEGNQKEDSTISTDNSVKKINEVKEEELIPNFSRFFKNKEIGLFLDKLIDINTTKILNEFEDYYSKGDWRNCIELLKKINSNKIFKILNKEKKIRLLDLLIKKILPNIHYHIPSNIIILLGNIHKLIPQDYIIDWKQFYALFYLLTTPNSTNIVDKFIYFYKSLHKYVPKDAMTYDEYQIIRKTFLDDLISQRHLYQVFVFVYFFPNHYINEDYQLQLRLLQMFTNSPNNFSFSCCLFSKILKKNGKLFFDIDKTKNDEYIKNFIQFYFTYLNLTILGDSSVIDKNYVSPKYINNEKSKQKNEFDHSITSILISLLFNENLKEYHSYTEAQLKIILNNKHLYLKEKSTDAITKNYITFLRHFLSRLHALFYTKIYDTKIFKHIQIIKPFEENQYKYNRLLDVLGLFSLSLNKLFLYENSHTCYAQKSFFDFLVTIQNNDYFKKLLINIDFEYYLKILEFLKENSETKMLKFVVKLYSIMPLLLHEYVYSNYPRIKSFIKENIEFLVENVSSANVEVDIGVLIIFSTYLYSIKSIDSKKDIYKDLNVLIHESTIKIMNNMIRILDLICQKNYAIFRVFIVSMKKYLDEKTVKIISETYANFVENNEIESNNLPYYFNVINEEEHIHIFNYIYNNLLFIDSSNNIEINKHFLYEKIDKDYNINVSQCSLEIWTEKQLQNFRRFISFINFSKILTDKKMISKFFEIFYALINQKDKKFKKLAYDLFEYTIDSLMNCHINEKNYINKENIELIEYPDEHNINLAVQIYEKLIIPYEQFVINYISDKNNNNIIKNYDFQSLEQIINIYITLMQKVSVYKSNILMLINTEEEDYKKIKELSIIEKQIQMYQKYNKYYNNSLKLIIDIFEYNKKNPENKLFNNHITNLFFDEIIAIKLTSHSPKLTNANHLYQKDMNVLYQFFHLPNFVDFWLLKSVYIFHTTLSELIKNFIPNDDLYYQYLYLYSQNYNSVAHPSSFISIYKNKLYSLDKEKIKKLFNQIYDDYIQKLVTIKEETETEQNIMKNICDSFLEYCLVYISLYQYDSIEVIEKLFKIMMILIEKKYRKFEFYCATVISNMQIILDSSSHCQNWFTQWFEKFSGNNDIIYQEQKKIYDLLMSKDKKEYIIQYDNNVKKFLDLMINLFYSNKNEKFPLDNAKINELKDFDINEAKGVLFFYRLTDYLIETFDKKDPYIPKMMKIIFENIFSEKIPIPLKSLWIKILHLLVKDEYDYYKKYYWIKFSSEEEYRKKWEEIKYENKGKENIISEPVSVIRKCKFEFNECLNENLKYNLNVEELLSIMEKIDEWEEDHKLFTSNNKKNLHSLDEVVSKLVDDNFKHKKGIDFKKVKMFYYLFQLKYIDYDTNDFAKHFNFKSTLKKEEDDDIDKNSSSIQTNPPDNNKPPQNNNNNNKKNKETSVKYEFILGKYHYMIKKKILNEETKKELWTIMNKFTYRIDKNADERIYAFFNFIFINFTLGEIEYVFEGSNFYQYCIDFVADMYFLFEQRLPKYKCETKMFDKQKTEELIDKIFSSDENLILDINYIIYILLIYYSINGYLKFNYYKFSNDYTPKISEHFMELMKKKDSKYSHFALYKVYYFYFICLNDDLNVIKASIQKMAQCVNEFMGQDKLCRQDEGGKILNEIESSFRNFTKPINFPALCDVIADILNKENDSNNTNKTLYLQVINHIYKGQKHLNLYKYSNKEIFDSLYKVFNAIKNEELKRKFASIFMSYFNDLTEEENQKFIEKYQGYIFDVDESDNSVNNINNKKANESENESKYNYIHILMIQLLRFKIGLPDYIQKFIIKLKIVNKKGGKIKKIICSSLKLAMEYYRGSYIFMKKNISKECQEVLEELTKEKSYFI